MGGATTRRIAATAKAPLASLHYCFSSKEDLLFAIYEQQAKTLQQQAWHIRQGAGLGRTAASLLRQLMSWWEGDDNYAQAQAELFFWALRQGGDLGTKAFQIHLDVMVECLRRGMRPGDDKSLVESLARVLTSTADGLLFQWFAFRDRDRLLADIDLATEALERLADAHRSKA